MAPFSGGKSLDLVINTEVIGNSQISNLGDLMSGTTKKIRTMADALREAAQAQKAFQKQSVRSIQRGSSIFAGTGKDGGPFGRNLQPANQALQEAQEMSLGANEGMRRYKQTTNAAGERVMAFMGSQERLNEIQKQVQESAAGAGEAFGENFGKYMNLMFAGMALNMVLGGVRRSMMKMTGASKALGVGMKSLLLPVFLALNPLFMELSNLMIGAPPIIKMLVGSLFLLASALAIVMLIGGQAGLFWQSWGEAIKGAVGGNGALAKSLGVLKSSLLTVAGAAKTALISVFQYVAGAVTSAIASTQAWVAANSALLLSLGGLLFTVGSLVLGILLLDRIFKKFGPVVGLLATIIGGVLLAALSPVAAIVLAIFGAFKAVNMIFKKFGKVIGAIATVVVGIIAVIIGVFASVPVAIGLAIGAALAFIWNFRKEIGNAIKGAIKFVKGIPRAFMNFLGNAADAVGKFVDKAVRFFKNLFKDGKKFVGNLIDFITSIPSKISNGLKNLGSAMLDVGKSIVNGVIDGIQAVGGRIADVFFGLLPDPLVAAIKQVGSGVGNLIQGVKDVLRPNDFILTSDGRMIQPDKNDTIVGFNGDGAIQPGQGGGDTVINVNDPVVREERDIDRIVDEVEERIDRNTRGRSGGLK